MPPLARLRPTCFAVALALGVLSGRGLAAAQAEADEPAATSDASAPATEEGDGPAVPEVPIITLDEEFVIEGRVRKPEAFFFLRRTPFGYVIRLLDDNFLEEIVRAAASDPF